MPNFIRRVHQRATQLTPGMVFETVLILPFYAPAWIIGKIARLLWAILAHLIAAIREGFMAAWNG